MHYVELLLYAKSSKNCGIVAAIMDDKLSSRNQPEEGSVGDKIFTKDFFALVDTTAKELSVDTIQAHCSFQNESFLKEQLFIWSRKWQSSRRNYY